MPRLTPEHTSNLSSLLDCEALLPRLHAALAEAAGVDIANVKSRVERAPTPTDAA